MRGRLRVDAGHGASLLADEYFIFGGSTESADQAVDLAAPQKWIKARCNHARASASKLKLVLVFAVHVPGFDPRCSGRQTYYVIDVAERLDTVQDCQLACGLVVVVCWKGLVQVLPHVDDQGPGSRAPAQEDVVLPAHFAHLARDL